MSGSSGLSLIAIIHLRNRLAILPRKRQPPPEIAMGFRGIRIEFDRAAERRDRLFGAPLHHSQIAERGLPP